MCQSSLTMRMVTDEDGMAVKIQKFWGELFCMKGNAGLNNIRKLLVDDGIIF